MAFQTTNGIRYFSSELFDRSVHHAFFTRQGGVSPEPWASLNMGATVGDDGSRVMENRLRAMTSMGLTTSSVFDVWQVHGVTVAIAEAPRLPDTPHQQADAILTNRPGITLMMRFADCVPIMLHDPVRGVAGIVHAGWMGTVLGVVRSTIQVMASRFGTDPHDICALIGPSIGPDHYEIGLDVAARVRNAYGDQALTLLSTKDDRTHFDLWAANRILLEESGVSHVEVAGLCTACHTEDWYSHRAEKGRTGRFGAVITLV